MWMAVTGQCCFSNSPLHACVAGESLGLSMGGIRMILLLGCSAIPKRSQPPTCLPPAKTQTTIISSSYWKRKKNKTLGEFVCF